MDQRRAIPILARCGSSHQDCNSVRPDNLYHRLPQRIGQAECVAADAEQSFRESGPHRFANPSKNTAGKAAAQLENRHPGSAPPSGAKYGRGEFRGQSGVSDPGAHAPWEGSLQSAIDRTATGRGGSAQCRKAGRGRGKKISDELGQSLRRCEIGVGKIHVLVDARAIEFRHAVFSRPMHGQTGWNRMVLFITRDSSDINAADEFA